MSVHLGPQLVVDARNCQVLRWALDVVREDRRRRDGAMPAGFEDLYAAVRTVAAAADLEQRPVAFAPGRDHGDGAGARVGHARDHGRAAREILIDDPISTTEAAEILGLSARQASRLASSEAFGPIERRGNRKVVSRRAVHDHAQARRRSTTVSA